MVKVTNSHLSGGIVNDIWSRTNSGVLESPNLHHINGLIMVTLWNRANHYIFILFLSSFFTFKLWFYVSLDTKSVILETFCTANSLA